MSDDAIRADVDTLQDLYLTRAQREAFDRIVAAAQAQAPDETLVASLRSLAAACYAGLVGACDLPEPWADAFLAASEGRPFTTDGLLPFTAARSPAPSAGVGVEGWPAALDWPSTPFTVKDAPGEHDPCWLVLPGGEMLAFNHHARNGVDQARAQFIAYACNATRLDSMGDRVLDRVLLQRDRYHEIADDLANGIAAHFGWNIGEHSNLNDPWQNALAMLSAAPSRPVVDGVEPLRAEVERLTAIINTPQSGDFLRAVSIEAEHQRQRWASDHDAGKTPADWFWLIGYLAGKALHSHNAGDVSKAEHHIITTAAACQNWHGAMFGATEMRPGIDGAAALGQQGDGNG